MLPPSVWMLSTTSGVKFQNIMAETGDQSLEAVADADDISHPVTVMEFHDERSDDIIDSRTETAAGDDGRLRLRRIEKEFLPRSRNFQGEGHYIR